MKEYKVYLNDLDYITLTDANNKLKDKGMIKSNIIFYNKIKYEDLYKIRSEISWYLVNQKCLDKINNLQSKIVKAIEYINNLRDESAERQEFYDCYPDDLYIPNIDELLDILEENKYE